MATITKRNDTYKITVSCGYDMTGKQQRKHFTWTPPVGMTAKQEEKELERQAVLFEERCRTGQVLDSGMRFADFIDKWLKYAENQLKPTTIAFYKTNLRRIVPALGNIRMDKLQPHRLLSFYDDLAAHGMRDDIKYKCLTDMKQLLKSQKLTGVKLAETSGVSLDVIRAIKSGRNVCAASAERIAKALGMDLDELFEPLGETTLSNRTIRHHHRALSAILGTAVQWGVISANPCARVKPPKAARKNPKFLDEEQAARLLELLESEDMQSQVMVKLLLFTGFRRGELCGLEWNDIDYDRRMIHVRRESLYLPGLGIYDDDAKTGTSLRSIKVPAMAFDMLKKYKAWQSETRLKLGDQWINTNRLFTKWNGKPIDPNTITAWFHDFIIKHGFPDVCIHSLRHTNATLLIASGAALPTVAKRLGHATTATTTSIYAHAIRSADEAAAETLENILNPLKKARQTP